MAEWCRLYPKDVEGEEAFWAGKKASWRERRRLRERRARKRFLKAELDNPNSTLDIEDNSPEWDNLRRTSEESSVSGSNIDKYFRFIFQCSLNLQFESSLFSKNMCCVCNISFIIFLYFCEEKENATRYFPARAKA
jgi:hypothetical protein